MMPAAVAQLMTTTIARTALGIEIDNSPATFGELLDSSDIAHDVEALRARMDEEGYIFLRDYLHRDEVLDARAEIVRRLDDADFLDHSYPLDDVVLRSDAELGWMPQLGRGNVPLMKVLYDGPMMDLYERFLGGEVRHFDYTWMRAVATGPQHSTAPHCDVVYMGRGTKKLYTSWTPLGDVPLEMGPIMMLEKSHRHERLNNNYGQKDVDRFCTNRRPDDYKDMGGGGNIARGGALSRNPVKLRKNLGGRWLTTEFRAGDLLFFTIFTVHASLDNTTNRIRLSSDSRYQLASEPVDERWIGENPIAHGPDAKRGMIC